MAQICLCADGTTRQMCAGCEGEGYCNSQYASGCEGCCSGGVPAHYQNNNRTRGKRVISQQSNTPLNPHGLRNTYRNITNRNRNIYNL